MLSSLLIATRLSAKTRSWGRQLSIIEQWYKTPYETTMIVSSWRQGKHVSRKPEQNTGSFRRYATGEIKKAKEAYSRCNIEENRHNSKAFWRTGKKKFCVVVARKQHQKLRSGSLFPSAQILMRLINTLQTLWSRLALWFLWESQLRIVCFQNTLYLDNLVTTCPGLDSRTVKGPPSKHV